MSGLAPFFPPSHPEMSIVRADGARLTDAGGREYVDLGISHGVANLGWRHPAVVTAIERQAGSVISLGSGLGTPARAEFLEALGSTLPPTLSRVFLSNSGTESVEAAIKFARSATGRSKIVAARRGFHGRTMGSLSATWRPELRAPFEPLVPEFVHVPYNDPAALEGAVDGATAMVLLEPVQGEGGVHVGGPDYLRAARAAAHRSGALLAWDEVQSGMGRTGRVWAFEHCGAVPDLLCAAKGLAGGVPIGATIATAEVVERFRGSHHSTFGGNPLACAAGAAAVRALVAERLPERAAALGARLIERLQRLPPERVREVRGVGLMVGVELREKVAPVLDALKERGFLALPAGATVLRLLPPLVIREDDLWAGVEAIEEVVGRG
ncbi:MAG TPA: aminotransferase class III-fold pyridoxal phosphate-dependent enzyme [Thermoplasmata archaeon]|nr:aminotransferase class III-fold pyridoxal phosphate-dependent enzyme [Thermoplasmata archaeon]